MTWTGNRSACVKRILVIFIVALALNYPWEIAQAPLYAGFANWSAVWWHCFVAALGDGILVWLIFVIGWIAFGHFDWYAQRDSRALALMLVAGLVVGFGIEWVAINLLGRWAYTVDMPLLPGLDVGLVPVLQMLLLPPAIFRIAARWNGKNCMNVENQQRIAIANGPGQPSGIKGER